MDFEIARDEYEAKISSLTIDVENRDAMLKKLEEQVFEAEDAKF
jgi:hypothetical protein